MIFNIVLSIERIYSMCQMVKHSIMHHSLTSFWNTCVTVTLRIYGVSKHNLCLILFFQILAPLLYVGLIKMFAWVDKLVVGNNSTDDINHLPIELMDLKMIYFTPLCPFTEKLMQNFFVIMDKLSLFYKFDYNSSSKSYQNEFLMMNDLQKVVEEENTKIAAFIFYNLDSFTETTTQLSYKIRLPLDQFSLQNLKETEDNNNVMLLINPYLQKGIIILQHILNTAFQHIIQPDSDYKVKISPMYDPRETSVTKMKEINIFMTVLILIIQGLNIYIPVKYMIKERELGTKELLNIMGLGFGTNWFGWYLCGVFSSLVLVGVMAWSWTKLLMNLNVGFIIIVILLYFHASLWMTYALSVIFSGRMSKYCGLYPYILGIVFSAEFNLSSSSFLVFLNHLIPPWTLGNLLRNMKEENTYAKIKTMTRSHENASDSVTFSLAVYVFDIVFYMFLLWYMQKVNPGKYGYAYPLCFLCTCLMPKKKISAAQIESLATPSSADKNKFQGNVNNLEVSVSIQNLYKVFGNFVAVNNVSIALYRNQVTALLGCNGAGKTTLLSMLTGMIKPTEGDIYIEGFNIKTNMREVRRTLSYCPQNDIYFPYLNVKEHLIYANLLKGLSCKNARANASELLARFNMKMKSGSLPEKLSGGMKRKLQLLMAVSGSSDVIILDEPSSGLDPESRRELWNIIMGIKEGRTIILTTHIMEEADALANQVAIMDRGVLQCYGTPVFLKSTYGIGYDLRVTMENKSNEKSITDCVKKSVPNAEISLCTGALALYQIPTLDSTLLSSLFSKLESRKQELSIISLGLSVRSIEYVFLKVRTQEESTSYDNKPNFDHKTGIGLCLWNIVGLLYIFIVYCYRHIIILLLSWALLLLYSNHQLTIAREQHSLANEKTYEFGMKMLNYPQSNCYYSVEENTEKLGAEFAAVVPNPIRVDNLVEKFKELAAEDIMKYLAETIISAQFLDEKTIGYYSTSSIHAVPEVIHAIDNAFVRMAGGSDYGIQAAFQPLKDRAAMHDGNLMENYFPNCITLLSIFFLLFFCDQQKSVKRIELIAGVDPIIYWTINVLLAYACIIPFVLIELNSAVKYTVFKDADDIHILTYMVHMTTLELILYIALMTFVFENWILIVIIIVIFSPLIQIIENLVALIKYLKYILPVVKFFSPYSNYHEFITNHQNALKMYSQCSQMPLELFHFCSDFIENEAFNFCCEIKSKDGFSKKYLEYGSLCDIIMRTHYFICGSFLLLIILENNLIGKIFWIFCNLCSSESASTVPDVVDEFQRIKENWKLQPNDIESDHLLVRNVKKTYLNTVVAVKGVSFGLMKGECFGLLGTNGAGKSTMFKILTHSTSACSGDAKINSDGVPPKFQSRAWRLSIGWPCFLHCIGYCPQENAIIENFTVYENLMMNVIIKGVPVKFWKAEINFWLEILGLQIYKKKSAWSLSGGNKRKLCVANAMIGNKEIIYLDEPTSGVDPRSRHSLWRLLTDAQRSGLSIVLTSHSMDECEALCQRLAILVQGEMRCIGPIEYLKHNYTQGFTVQMRLRGQIDPGITNNIIEVMRSHFPTVLKDKTPGFLTVMVADSELTLSYMFQKMETIKRTFLNDIEEFTITDTSLEDIFISFAKTNKRR